MTTAKAQVLDLTGVYQTAEKIESGEWFTLDSGLEVLVARGGSPEFYRVAAAAGKKFGKRGKDIPPEKNLDSLLWVMARANFKSFKGPDGEKKVAVEGSQFEDTAQGRQDLLFLLPDLRDDIMALAGSTAEEFQMEIDEAGKG